MNRAQASFAKRHKGICNETGFGLFDRKEIRELLN